MRILFSRSKNDEKKRLKIMKQIFKLIANEPLPILCNKINKNILKQIGTNINSTLLINHKKFKYDMKKKQFIIIKSLQFLFKNILLSAIKKRHLNASKNWISEKYFFFLSTYKIKANQKHLLSTCSPKFSLKLSRGALFSFIYFTNKLPLIFHKKSLKKKINHTIVSIKKFQSLLLKKNVPSKKLNLKKKIGIKPIEFEKLEILKKQMEKNKKKLQAGSGSSFLILFNVQPYKLTQNTKPSTSNIRYLNKQKKISPSWNSIVNNLIIYQDNNPKSQINQFSLLKKFSQILTTFFLIPNNEVFSVQRSFYSKNQLKSSLRKYEFAMKTNKKNDLKINKNSFIDPYPVFFDFQAKLNSIETSLTKENKIFSDFSYKLKN